MRHQNRSLASGADAAGIWERNNAFMGQNRRGQNLDRVGRTGPPGSTRFGGTNGPEQGASPACWLSTLRASAGPRSGPPGAYILRPGPIRQALEPIINGMGSRRNSNGIAAETNRTGIMGDMGCAGWASAGAAGQMGAVEQDFLLGEPVAPHRRAGGRASAAPYSWAEAGIGAEL